MAAEVAGGATGWPVAVCLTGPTASGKTGLAIELARRYPFGIISVDSAMVYRGMNIGTGKPDAGVLEVAPHRLIDLRDPWERYSAGEFLADAGAAMAEVRSAGLIPLFVGGTLLYFRSLFGGLSRLPSASPEVRNRIDEQAASRGWPAMHAELAELDPAAAARIGPGDRQRIQRALEVHILTGRPISAQQTATGVAVEGGRFIRIALSVADRAALHRRIADRLEGMLAAGFIDEVATLQAIPAMHAEVPAMRAVGYRQLWPYVAGQCSRNAAVERALAATRQLARRQLTWLRSECWDAQVDMMAPDILRQVVSTLRGAGLADAISPLKG